MKKITITNYLMFNLVMRNPVFCKDVIERILGRKIADIRYNNVRVTAEDNITVGLDTRNLRLDVRFEDDTSWYNVEMQVQNHHDIPKRTRYHHSLTDMLDLQQKKAALKASGSNRRVTFNDLKESFVIVICCFDPYERGRSLYWFDMRERMENDLCMGDESSTIMLNTTVVDEYVSPELKAFIEYVRDDVVDQSDTMLADMDRFILDMNEGEGGILGMTWEEELFIAKEYAMKEGREEGREEGLALSVCNLMKSAGIEMKEAMDMLGIEEEMRDKLAKLI